jgi:hypothetical protein
MGERGWAGWIDKSMGGFLERCFVFSKSRRDVDDIVISLLTLLLYLQS